MDVSTEPEHALNVPSSFTDDYMREVRSGQAESALNLTLSEPSVGIGSPMMVDTDNEETLASLPFEDIQAKLNTAESATHFKLHNLLYSADQFICMAHKNASNVHSSEQNGLQYYKLIKAAIACLLVVVKKYKQSLTAESEATVFLKLAHLYFEETRNTSLAEVAVNKAMSIATRSNLIRLKFQAEYLAVQILFTATPKLGLKCLNSMIAEYEGDQSFDSFLTLLQLLKFKYMSAMDHEYDDAILQKLADKENVDSSTKQLILCYRIPQLLSSGDLDRAEASITEAEKSSIGLAQINGMICLYKIWLSLLKNNFDAAKLGISQMDAFIKQEKQKGWVNWNDDGTFKITIQLDNGSHEAFPVSFQVIWMSNKEFLFMMYFVSGIAYIPKSVDCKGKAAKFFNACEAINAEQKTQLISNKTNFDLADYEYSTMRLSYIEILLRYYQITARFNSGKFKIYPKGQDKVLFDFVDKYDEGMLSSQELAVYHKLFPHILYLFGAYYHGIREFAIAKNYYNRIRSHLRRPTLELTPESRFTNDAVTLSLLQMNLGLGGDTSEHRSYDNEIYLFASLNLLTILSWEVKTTRDENEHAAKRTMQRAILNDLMYLLQTEKESTLISISDPILNTTIQLFQVIYDSATLSESKESITLPSNVDIMSAIMTSKSLMSHITSNYPVLASVLFYLSSYCIVDPTVKMKNLQTSYYYAKVARNLKLLGLNSMHIYELMTDNSGDVYSREEIKDQRLKYKNYFDMYNKRFGLTPEVAKPTANDPSSEGGLYDNEKNDNYYDNTVADMTQSQI